MSTQIDWHQEIDTSFGEGPDRPPADYSAAGRRALHRRRRGAGAAALATALVVGGIGWSMTPGGDGADNGAPVAVDPSRDDAGTGDPTAAADPQSGRDETRPDRRMLTMPWGRRDAPARAMPGTGLQLREGAVVHERRDDPYQDKDTESVALDVSFEGKRWWLVLEWGDGGSASTSSAAGERHDTFDQFVAETVSDGGMFTPTEEELEELQPFDDLVDYSPQGLQVRDGVEVVRRVENPLGLEAPRASLGVVLEHDGTTTWMLLSADGNGSGSSHEEADRSGWPTFDLWLADQVALQSGDRLALATLAEDGTVRPEEPDVEVLDQRTDPDLPEYVDRSALGSAVAMLRWRGQNWFVVLVRYPGGEDAVITYAASKARGAEDLDSFVAFARDRADEGGLR